MTTETPTNFEDALRELEAIVRSLEEGKTSLDTAIKAYERGALLRSYCEEQLQSARLRISQVVVGSSNSAPVLEPLDPISF